jgi:hypothetical protein
MGKEKREKYGRNMSVVKYAREPVGERVGRGRVLRKKKEAGVEEIAWLYVRGRRCLARVRVCVKWELCVYKAERVWRSSGGCQGFWPFTEPRCRRDPRDVISGLGTELLLSPG